MSNVRERAIVFAVGLVVGSGVGVAVGRALYNGVGYEIFKQDELAVDGEMDFSAPEEFATEAIDTPATTEAEAEGEAEQLSDAELDELKRLILPRLQDADIEAWKKSRSAQSPSAGDAPGG
jgi:hypothetical protein